MYRTNIYCRRDCHNIRQQVKEAGFQIEQRLSLNSFDIISLPIDTEITKHNLFLKQFEQDPNIIIYYDDRHPKCLRHPLKISGGLGHNPPPQQKSRSFQRSRGTKNSVTPLKAYVDNVPSDITPTTMKSYYNVPTYDPETTPRPQIAVISLGGYYQLSDLTYFWDVICQLPIGGIRPTITDHLIGNHSMPIFSQNLESLENTLDLELIGGFCPNAHLHFYSAPNTYQGYKLAFEQAISDGMNIISTSWGQSEETFYGGGGLDGFEDVFVQAVTLYNICIVAASGDFGSSDNNYTTINVPPYPVPVPVPHCNFPASSPSVVACGGTSLYFDIYNEETVWRFGGGGQSSHFPRPAYQGAWSPNWPVSPIVYGGTSAPNARTIPDIAFNADPNSPWHIYFAGYDDEGAGTSASAPIMAGILGVFYASSNPDSAPRNGYFGQGFNYFLYRSPTSSVKTINHGNNITVDRSPITNEPNPFGLFQLENNTYYAVFSPIYSFCGGKGVVSGETLLTYLNTVVCVGRGTRILLDDGQLCPIQQITRGMRVVGHNGHRYPVADVNRQVIAPNATIDLVELTPHCLGKGHPDQTLWITPNHPIFYDKARRPAKTLVNGHDIILHSKVHPEQFLESDEEKGQKIYYLYDLQFEDDGSYIANYVTIQSRSPFSNLTPLPKELYFDQSKYTTDRHWDSLDQTLPLIM